MTGDATSERGKSNSCCREAGATTAATIAAVRVSHYGFPEQSLVVPQVVQLIENRNVNALTLLMCYNITTEQHWDPITTTK